MRIAVIQHLLRATPEDDARGLAEAAVAAAAQGAEFVVMPEVATLGGPDAPCRAGLFELLDAQVLPPQFIPYVGDGSRGTTFAAPLLEAAPELGAFALLMGDACVASSEWAGVLAVKPQFAILCPRSESDLQAEAVLEVAIALSDALCGLVIVAECAGGEPGETGHGGSAIVMLGEVLAEAVGQGDVLVADITVPVPQPEPREPLPQLPTILAQRLANHGGTKLDMGYLADLSDGPSQR